MPRNSTVVLALLAAVLASLAHAGTFVLHGSFYPGLPPALAQLPVVSDGRCSGAVDATGPASYQTFALTAGRGGAHSFVLAATGQVRMYVYAGAFDPSQPAERCVAGGGEDGREIVAILDGNAPYTVVAVDVGWDYDEVRFAITVRTPPEPPGCAGFADLERSSPFCPAVTWAVRSAIVTGCTSTAFCPDARPTRTELVVALHAFARAGEPRLAAALDTSAAHAINAADVACVTAPVVVPEGARMATPRSAVVVHGASASVQVGTRLVYRLDQEPGWRDMSDLEASIANPPRGTAAQSPVAAPLVLDSGRRVQFAIAGRALDGVVDTAQCALSIAIHPGRLATSSP